MRYPADAQDPTLFDLIEAGADDNADLILAQLFDEADLSRLRQGLQLLAETEAGWGRMDECHAAIALLRAVGGTPVLPIRV